MRAMDGGAAAGTSGSSGSSQSSGPTGATRRRLLLAGSAGAASVLIAGCSTALVGDARTIGLDPFTLGVASGYPTPEGVVLWTRLAPGTSSVEGFPDESALPGRVSVTWEVARDEGMRNVVATGRLDALADSAHSVHVEVAGLAAASWYWYRFTALGHRSRDRPHAHPASRASRHSPTAPRHRLLPEP